MTPQTDITKARPPLPLWLVASFTAEPFEPTLRFWLDELGFDGEVHFAGYNQVLAQLLDPGSELGRNTLGVGVVLVRFEDWTRFLPEDIPEATALWEGVTELAAAVREFAARSTSPLIVAVGPASSQVSHSPTRKTLHETTLARLRGEIAGLESVHWLEPDSLGLETLDPEDVDDPRGDAIGHMPYAPLAYAGIATALARRIDAIKSPRAKVLALDCDNTLWKGVVGEDGPLGVTFPTGLLAVQEFAVKLQEAGVIVCLLSKNVEADVQAVFDARYEEMALKREHVIAERVNWQSKSDNIRELASELNLGLDSFVFLDDNPVECAEMRARRPEVITLQIPSVDAEIPGFVHSIWSLDILKITEEDRRRTSMYRENAERERFARTSDGIEGFLSGLELKIEIDPPADDEWSRVAQLTQKTNQFNFTTLRRTESEIRHLQGKESLRVNVRDRFGDYGLVGVVIFGEVGDGIEIDSFLLSCRVLGRGVEHAMLARIGKLAIERGKARVNAIFRPTAKNEPALSFLQSVGSSYKKDYENTSIYSFPASEAVSLVYSGASSAIEPESIPAPIESRRTAKPRHDRAASYCRIATELQTPSQVLAEVERRTVTSRPNLGTSYQEPRTSFESDLALLWSQVLGIEQVGINDDFTNLGGTSLKAANLFVEIDKRFGRRLPMTTILESPTVATLAAAISGAAHRGPRESLRLLRSGGNGAPPIFFIHDGDGETFLYMNLARRLPDEFAVYGIEPRGDHRIPMLHTRIPEMAAFYRQLIRKIQPVGPYILGGMCAGGTIAFEMALQFEAAGETVGFVALLDPAAPLAQERTNRTAELRRERFRQAMREKLNHETMIGRLFGRIARTSRKIKGFAVYQVKTCANAVANRLKFQTLRKAIDRGAPVPRFCEGLSVRRVYELAETEYIPARKLEAPAVLFRATEGVGADTPFIDIFEDALLGWGQWVCKPVLLREMPGGHSSMLREPNVGVMAERFHDCLFESRGVEAGAQWTS